LVLHHRDPSTDFLCPIYAGLPGTIVLRRSVPAAEMTELIRTRGWAGPPILVDQGGADPFLVSQLKPELLEAAAAASGQKLTLRRHAGYDHGYYFIQSFVADHLAHHARQLG
jgi:S-formylglutathione hydrolase